MATVVFKNARLYFGDASLAVQCSELAVNYGAEMLPYTTFGSDTRGNIGGLKMADISGKGYADLASGVLGIENVLFSQVGTDDIVVTVFADGVTEGSTSGGDMGYAMKGVLSQFTIGGPVGSLLEVSFKVEARGIAA
jgi:hypothetical protein